MSYQKISNKEKHISLKQDMTKTGFILRLGEYPDNDGLTYSLLHEEHKVFFWKHFHTSGVQQIVHAFWL